VLDRVRMANIQSALLFLLFFHPSLLTFFSSYPSSPTMHRYYQHVDHEHAQPDPEAAERALAEALEKRAGGPPPPSSGRANQNTPNNKPLHMMASLAHSREAKRQAKEGRVAAQADWGVEGHGDGEAAADLEAREEEAAAFATGSTALHSLAAEVMTKEIHK